MRIGSLFSGIGLLDLGLERAGVGRTVWQVELNPKARLVLEHHWPEATRYEDVRSVGAATLAPVDLICGGFPCQDVSSAGKRVGLAGARSGLWFEFHRIVSELLPQWVVVENVTSGADRWVDRVVAGLEQLGYACLPIPLAAADVGAPHLRARVFVVAAHTDRKGESARAEYAEVASASAAVANADGEQRDTRKRGAEPEGTRRPIVAGGRSKASADALRTRREGSGPGAHEEWRRPSAGHWRTPEPPMVRMVHGRAARVDGRNARSRIEALGNSVVPQCAEVVGHVIQLLRGAA